MENQAGLDRTGQNAPSSQWPDRFSDAMEVNLSPDERLYSAGAGALLTIAGVRVGGFFGTLMLGAGAYLLFRGGTGYCAVNNYMDHDTSRPEDKEVAIVDITQTVRVDKPIAEVYRFWRQLDNLPSFMEHLESVTEEDGNRSRWSARIPGGLGTIDWEAEITQEVANEVIAWQSLPGADVENAGEVRFRALPGNRGTEVEAKISYRPPAAGLGAGLAKVLNPVFGFMVRQDISRFADHMEGKDVKEQSQETAHRGIESSKLEG